MTAHNPPAPGMAEAAASGPTRRSLCPACWHVPRPVRAGLGLVTAVAVLQAVVVLAPGVLPVAVLEPAVVGGVLMGIGLVVVRAVRASTERLVWTCLGTALLCWAIGTLVYLYTPDSPVTEGLAVGLWWVFYPLAYVALAAIVRSHQHRLSAGLVLDGLAAGFAAAAVVAAYALTPELTSGQQQFLNLGGTVTAPIFDVLLLGTGVGLLVLMGRPVVPAQVLLIAALSAYATADMIWLFQVAGGGYRPNGIVDALFMLSVTLTAWAAWRRPVRGAASPTARSELALLVPLAATLLGLAVLVGDHLHRTTPLALALATTAVLLSGIRAATTIRSVRLLGEARRLARTDDLTGLANRRAMLAGLRELASPRGGDPKALILVDLDRFKEVNDSLGHDAGDQLLDEVGRRLTSALPYAEIMARLGGDEFAALLDGVGAAPAGTIGRHLRETLSEPIDLGGVVVHVEASIGVAACPEHSRHPEDMLRLADIAMYRAKRTMAGVAVYDPALDHVDRDGIDRVHELRAALDGGEMVLHYQPRLNLRTGRIRWVEALLRWRHPRLGLLSPMEFLPIAEYAGLMRSVTSFVVSNALAQTAAWRAAGLELAVSINISGSDLADPELPDEVVRASAAHGVPADAVQIEVTEMTLVADRERGAQLLDRLRDIGMRVAVDDYGSGYSSLAYLCDLPVDDLKLDRSFCANLLGSRRAASVVRSTIQLAHELGMRLVAEGVETPEVLSELVALGCDEAQGFYVSSPLPPDELERWLGEREALWPLRR